MAELTPVSSEGPGPALSTAVSNAQEEDDYNTYANNYKTPTPSQSLTPGLSISHSHTLNLSLPRALTPTRSLFLPRSLTLICAECDVIGWGSH